MKARLYAALTTIAALAVISWMPLGILFVFMGIWGDRRWLVTGLVMLGVAALTLFTALIHRRLTNSPANTYDHQDWRNLN